MKKFNLFLLLGFFVFALSPQVFAQQNQASSTELPASFPKYKDTGNAEADAARYENAKKAWVQSNPEKYAELTRDNAILLAKELANTSLPANYKVPAYISEWKSLDSVFETLGSRYPEFYQKEGEVLIAAIRQNPARYRTMYLESLAIRTEYVKRN